MTLDWNERDHPRDDSGRFRESGNDAWISEVINRLDPQRFDTANLGPNSRPQIARLLDQMSGEIDNLTPADRKKVERKIEQVRRDVVTAGAAALQLREGRFDQSSKATVGKLADILDAERDPRYPGRMMQDLFKVEDMAAARRYWNSLNPEQQEALDRHLGSAGLEGTVANILRNRRDAQEYAQFKQIQQRLGG